MEVLKENTHLCAYFLKFSNKTLMSNFVINIIFKACKVLVIKITKYLHLLSFRLKDQIYTAVVNNKYKHWMGELKRILVTN